ncbi:hypothetical protein HPP92_020952 [Vanilla planifolia]|uniref:Uncharacterized protein n=1 Tax=Vanilla planifolia TaxID=51239 RepID=A0A835PUQ3_VANPL|nr:hypothetical protein HPP92_020952 [Vanilla planifolia]
MKKAGILVASSVAAAAASSSASLSSAHERCATLPFECKYCSSSIVKEAESGSGREESIGRFAPRFDGLRFIETLVTAHR